MEPIGSLFPWCHLSPFIPARVRLAPWRGRGAPAWYLQLSSANYRRKDFVEPKCSSSVPQGDVSTCFRRSDSASEYIRAVFGPRNSGAVRATDTKDFGLPSRRTCHSRAERTTASKSEIFDMDVCYNKRIFDFRLQESPIHKAIAVMKTAFASRYLCWDEHIPNIPSVRMKLSGLMWKSCVSQIEFGEWVYLMSAYYCYCK